MSRENVVPIRLNDRELERLDVAAAKLGVMRSQFVRRLINKLPEPTPDQLRCLSKSSEPRKE